MICLSPGVDHDLSRLAGDSFGLVLLELRCLKKQVKKD